MKNKVKRLFSLLLTGLLLFSLAGCGSASVDESEEASAAAESDDTTYKIGVAVYSTTDPEMTMFYNYYRNYIAESFPVEFIMSGDLDSIDDEIAFVEEAKEEGASAIISFYGTDLESVVAACEENEMYYVLGSSSISDSEFEAVKDNEWFLGVIGPDTEEEYNAGKEMAEDFIADGAGTFLIVSGGAGNAENYMHYTRVEGMLTAIQDELGVTYADTIENLAQVTEVTQVETGRDDVAIVITPGYIQLEEGQDNLFEALDMGRYDALLSAVGLSTVFDYMKEDIETDTALMRVGVVDCFSQENYDAIYDIADNGYGMLHYVKGKYASMVAPAFVAVFNALKGDADLVNPDGEAFRIYQSYWTAASDEEYAELFGYTQSIYENAYSSTDLMSVIRAYNPDATYEGFVELAQSSDLESVMERLSE